MRISFHPEAESEFEAAVQYYEFQQPGLGMDFLESIRSMAERIAENPESWPILRADARKCISRAFPFNVYFAIRSDNIHILAIAHHRRKPYYWAARR